MDEVFWTALGLLICIIGLVAWALRRKWRREGAERAAWRRGIEGPRGEVVELRRKP